MLPEKHALFKASSKLFAPNDIKYWQISRFPVSQELLNARSSSVTPNEKRYLTNSMFPLLQAKGNESFQRSAPKIWVLFHFIFIIFLKNFFFDFHSFSFQEISFF